MAAVSPESPAQINNILMSRFDLHKTIIQTSGNAMKNLAEYNPLFIHKKGTRVKAFFALGMVCFFWGTTWVASREGVRHMPALQMAGIRQLLGGIIYVIFFIAKGVSFPRGKEWVPIIVMSILNFMLSNALSTWGVKYISAGLGSILGAIFPLWLVVIGLFSSAAKIPARAIIGLLLGFAGVCIIFIDHLNDLLNPEFRFGIILSIIATWTWAFGILYTKKQALRFNPYFSLGLQMVISGLVLIGITEAGNDSIPISAIPWQSWAAIWYLIIFSSILTFIAFLYALQNLPTELTSIYAYITPVVAVLLGWLILNEKLTLIIALGGAVTLLGVYIVNNAYKISSSVPAAESPDKHTSEINVS